MTGGAPVTRPGTATSFEGLVDDYDAGRPAYPTALYDALPPLAGAPLLELGAGTGIATRDLAGRGALVVSTDLGPRMLGRLHARLPQVPVVVARAEALPFVDGAFEGVAGAQMWHWVDVPAAAGEVARVLAPGGWLALWWNDVDADGLPWWEAQQARLEEGNAAYRRDYRGTDYGGQLLATGLFTDLRRSDTTWERTLELPTYERWLRSKSYVHELADVDGFVAASLADLREVFPDGVVHEPFVTRLFLLRRC